MEISINSKQYCKVMDSVEWFNNYSKEEDPNCVEKHSRPPDTLHNIEEDLVTTTPPPEQKPKLFINKTVKNDPDAVVSLIDDEEEEEAVESYRNETREALHELVGLESESEYKFIEAIEKYRDILESQVELFSGKHLKEAVTKDLLFITTNYKKIGIMYIEKYLDIMSEILVFVCDVIRNFFTSHKYFNMKVVKKESRRIKMLLRDCLLNRLDRIMHILLRVRVANDVMEHQVLWAGIFRYFLARVSTYHNKDDIVRGFIIFQRLKKTRPEKEGPTIESYMYKVFKKTKRELRKIPILDEIFEKIENDPLYSVRDMCVHYNRYYKKKQNDTSYYDEESRKNVIETDVFDSNWKPRFDLSQIFFSNLSNSSSTFFQILAERKPLEGLWGPNRLDSHDKDIFGGNHMKLDTKAGIKTDGPVVILDDSDDDDDGVVLISEDIKTITVPSDSENSKSSFEDMKCVRVSDMVEASAQTEEDQEPRIVVLETPIEDKPTCQADPPEAIPDNIASITPQVKDNSNIVELGEGQDARARSPLNAQTTECQAVPASNEIQQVDDTQINVDVPSPNEGADTISDDGLNKDNSPEPATSRNTKEDVPVLSQDVGDETVQDKPSDKIIENEYVLPLDRVIEEEKDIHEQSNQKEDHNEICITEEALPDNTAIDKDNSSSNKPQDESSVELPVQAECDTTDNNPIESRLPSHQTPTSNNSIVPSFESINAVKAKAYFDQFELNCRGLNRISEADDDNAIRSMAKRNKSEKQLECDSTVERLSIANSSEESLGCEPDEVNADADKFPAIVQPTSEPKVLPKEASNDGNQEKPSSKLIEFFQSFAVEETDAIPLSELGQVATNKDDHAVELEAEEQVILYANSPTMLSVSDSLIIDESSPKPSPTPTLSDFSETLLSLDQMKISSGDGRPSDTESVGTPKALATNTEVTTLLSPGVVRDQICKNNDISESNGSLKVRLPLVHCTEALDKLPLATHHIKKAPKEGKSLKRRRSSVTKTSEQHKTSHKTDSDSWHQSKRSLGNYFAPKNSGDTLPQHTELFNYSMEGPLQKPLANGKNSIDTWSWWNEEESQWNDSSFSDFDANKTRISVIPDTQLCQSKQSIYPKTSETTTKSSKSGGGSGRVTFQLPKPTVPKKRQQARAKSSKDPSVEKMNEKVQRSLQPIEILCCLFKEQQMSKSHDKVVIAEGHKPKEIIRKQNNGQTVARKRKRVSDNELDDATLSPKKKYVYKHVTINDTPMYDNFNGHLLGKTKHKPNGLPSSTGGILKVTSIRNNPDGRSSDTTDKSAKSKLKKIPHKAREDYTKSFANGHN